MADPFTIETPHIEAGLSAWVGGAVILAVILGAVGYAVRNRIVDDLTKRLYR